MKDEMRKNTKNVFDSRNPVYNEAFDLSIEAYSIHELPPVIITIYNYIENVIDRMNE